MLTPAFELSQDEACLTIIIKARFARVSETEVFVDGSDFKFYSRPYFLRLNLPGKLLEDGKEKAAYDAETGIFTIKIPKETRGEHFEGLDLLTRLLAPKGQTSAQEPCIQVLGAAGSNLASDNGDDGDGDTGEVGDAAEPDVKAVDEEDIDWQVHQEPYHGDERDDLTGTTQYGFANRRSGVFKRLRDEICGVVDIMEADSVTLPERKRARMMEEKDKFDDSHYLADLYQHEAIQPLLQFKPSWVRSYKKMREKVVSAGDAVSDQYSPFEVSFCDEEKELMRKLPRKHYILDSVEERGALLGVVDILFAYAYNARTTEGENSVESAWTLCKLSSTLSCLDWFNTPRELVVACCRRALCYPLYRNWDLCMKILKDVRMILRLGRNQVLKCFFEVHRLLSSDEPRYILNDLYITDYCVWLQSVGYEKLAALEEEIAQVEIKKKEVDLDLDDLEQAASMVEQEDVGMETERSDGAKECYQLGYPDLIQRSNCGPDIVTTHTVALKAKEIDLKKCQLRRDISDDVGGDDDDDDNGDEENTEDDSSENSIDDTESSGEVEVCGTSLNSNSESRTESLRACTTSSDIQDERGLALTSPTRVSEHAVGGKTGIPDGADNGELLRRTLGEHDDVEIVETMDEMLTKLSLEPSSVSRQVVAPDARGSKSLSEWAQTPPTKPIELYDGN